MKLKSLFIKTIAIGAVASLAVNCHAKKVEDNPLLFFALAQTVTGLGKGNCAISVNGTAIYYGKVEETTISGVATAALGGADAAWVTHYNAINGTSVTAGTLATTQPYNKKYDTFYTDSATWTSTNRAALLNTVASSGALAALVALRGIKGSGMLACGRIPKANCSVAGLSTSTQAQDIQNAVDVYNLISNNSSACRKGSFATDNAIKNAVFRGLSTAVSISEGTFTPSTFGSPTSFSSSDGNATAGAPNYTHVEGNQILASKAYPKIGALVSLGYGSLMPVREGTTPYALDATSYTPGSNIAALPVTSCEALGLPGTGFTITGTNELSNVKEVLYAFSKEGAAASAYALAVGATATSGDLGGGGDKPIGGIAKSAAASLSAVNDAISCNSAMRAKISIPLAIGGGKLDSLNVISGDGFNTRLLTTCVYGNTTPRTTLATILDTNDDTGLPATLKGIAACPAIAAAGAAKFGDAGLQNLANFPND